MFTYGRQPFTIVGYSFQADIYCPDCTRDIALFANDSNDIAELSLNFLLARWADQLGIDNMNESSYDHSVFPKVVFASDVSDDNCGSCHETL